MIKEKNITVAQQLPISQSHFPAARLNTLLLLFQRLSVATVTATARTAAGAAAVCRSRRGARVDRRRELPAGSVSARILHTSCTFYLFHLLKVRQFIFPPHDFVILTEK